MIHSVDPDPLRPLRPLRSAGSSPEAIVTCFAVREEAVPFKKRLSKEHAVRLVLTGMGKRNAESKILHLLAVGRPRLVLSCGFAGGLNPNIARGTVLFSVDASQDALAGALLAAGARIGRFHCSDRVLWRTEEKREVYGATGADAVEMESEIIRRRCHEDGIPSATIRVISDSAHENLPLDFNRFYTREHRLNYPALIGALLARPRLIRELNQFRQRINDAAQRLAEVLRQVI